MTQCYGWKGKDGLGNPVAFLACVSGTAAWTPNPTYSGNYYFPSDNGVNLASGDYGATPVSITPLNSQAEIDAWSNGASYGGPGCASCINVNVQKLYDCINGKCQDSTTYKTPGLYKSLADCQAVCANGGACAAGKQCVDPTNYCPNGKVCIDQDEYSNIQGLIAKINSEVC